LRLLKLQSQLRWSHLHFIETFSQKQSLYNIMKQYHKTGIV